MERLSFDYLIDNPWLLPIVYYIIRQVVRLAVSGWFHETDQFLNGAGSDLCFIGFTVFAAAILDERSVLSQRPMFDVFIFSFVLLGMFILSYFTFRKAGSLTDRRRSPGEGKIRIIGMDVSGDKWIKVSEIAILGISWLVGGISYTLAISLWTSASTVG